jgi:hypothetical protein
MLERRRIWTAVATSVLLLAGRRDGWAEASTAELDAVAQRMI